MDSKQSIESVNQSRVRPGGVQTSVAGGEGARKDSRIKHALSEFLLVPTLVALAFVVLAAGSIALDQAQSGWVGPLRDAAGHFVGKSAAQSALQQIAGGVVTVTSITFSVLLLAVQQTASSLSPMVFDQFLRRRINQVYLGFFVGLAVYSYLVLAAVRDKTPPILGATIAVVLTVVALGFLLVLVYSTINQMRPTNVVGTMRGHTMAAYVRERPLVDRTRRVPQQTDGARATYLSNTTGYVTAIDLDGIAAAIGERERCEVQLHVSLGSFVAHSDPIATVVDDEAAYAERVADAVRHAVALSRNPDPDVDATTGLVELTNVAWTSISTAKHNPGVGLQALDALRDLLQTWQTRDANQTDDHDREVLPIVYQDTDERVLFDSIYSLLVAAAESHQHQTAAHVLGTYAQLLPTLTEEGWARALTDLWRVGPLLSMHPASVQLQRALTELCGVLEAAGERALSDYLDQVWQGIAASVPPEAKWDAELGQGLS